eukprot:SAG11_NODE_12553_length_697_cov_1.299331_1_plen_91_part_10
MPELPGPGPSSHAQMPSTQVPWMHVSGSPAMHVSLKHSPVCTSQASGDAALIAWCTPVCIIATAPTCGAAHVGRAFSYGGDLFMYGTEFKL